EIAEVLGRRLGLDRDLFEHGDAEALNADDLLRVVREDADRRQTEHGEDLVADAVVAHVRLEAELGIRLHRVGTGLLQLVRAQLVQQADAATLLRHVEEYPALLRRDLAQRLLELLAAVAAQRVEDVAGEALGVNTNEDVLVPFHLTLDEGDV